MNTTNMGYLDIAPIVCQEIPRQFLGNVNVTCTKDFRIILWNKYHVMICNNIDYCGITEPLIINSDFVIEKVLLYKNCLLCLDCSGNININTIITSNAHFDISSTFTITHQQIKACEITSNNDVISLKMEENFTILSIHKFNSQLLVKDTYKFPNINLEWQNAPRGKNIIVSDFIEIRLLDSLIRKTFGVQEDCLNHLLIVISLDRINVYACIIPETQNKNLNLKNLQPVNLYKSNSEIIGMNISTKNDICILVGLSSGNIIKVPLIDIMFKPMVIHRLNAALYKFAKIENAIIYTDGLTMWKIKDAFPNLEPNQSEPEQLFVKNVRDFCIINNNIICTTFSNLIYSFYIFDNRCYVKPNDDYKTHLLTNSDYLDKINNVVHENEELVKNINKESEYLIGLSLCNRQDIMNQLIQISSNVFDNYNDLTQAINELTLVDETTTYDLQSYYFVIKISVITIQHKLNKLLSDALGDIKIHITFFAHKVLKTTSIKISEQLRKKNLVIPLRRSKIGNIKKVQAVVKIVTNIPAQMDEKQRLWIVLYRKCINFNAENFIRTINFTNSIFLKVDDTPLETVICKNAEHLYGTRYTFKILDKQGYQWTSYIKLPANYSQILHNEKYYANYVDFKKRNLLMQSIGNCPKSEAEFDIGDEKVILSIKYNGSFFMSVSCPNINIVWDIRNLFSNIIFTALKDNQDGPEFVDLRLCNNIKLNMKQYISPENIQSQRKTSEELLTNFYRTIFCSLPL